MRICCFPHQLSSLDACCCQFEEPKRLPNLMVRRPTFMAMMGSIRKPMVVSTVCEHHQIQDDVVDADCRSSWVHQAAAVKGSSPDLKGMRHLHPLLLPDLDLRREMLPSQRICNHAVMINLLNGSDRPIRASPAMGSMAATSRKMELGLSVIVAMVDGDNGGIGIRPSSSCFSSVPIDRSESR
ncbi:hypothetical protein ACLOJK_007420 [Asimina triloba]